MNVVDYARAVLRSWAVIALLGLAGAAAGYGLAVTTAPVYRSSGAVLVTSDRGNSATELVQGSAYIQNLVATYVLLASSEVVLDPVIEELDLGGTARGLAGAITASAPLDSVIIEITASSESPELARDIAAATIASLSDVVTSEVAPTDENGEPTVRLTTIENPSVPRFAATPVVRNNVVLGAIAGLGLGLVLAILRAVVWRSIRTHADIRRLTALPVLGQVVEARRGSTLTASILREPLGIEADSVRTVAANLNFLKVDGGLRSIVVTSGSPAEAKSSLVVALGLMVAESSRRVLIIDADLRSPSIAAYTHLTGSVGLTNVIIGETDLGTAVQEWGAPGLSVLTAGTEAPNPSQLLTSQRMTDLLAEAEAAYDFVIVDSAPLLAVTDATWLGNQTDGALLTVLYGKTTAHALERVIAASDAGGLNLLGAVLTRVPRRGVSRYGAGTYGASSDASPLRSRRRRS